MTDDIMSKLCALCERWRAYHPSMRAYVRHEESTGLTRLFCRNADTYVMAEVAWFGDVDLSPDMLDRWYRYGIDIYIKNVPRPVP